MHEMVNREICFVWNVEADSVEADSDSVVVEHEG